MAGDDYGRPTDSWLGIRFYHPRALVAENLRGVPLHPTQLYMSVNALWLFWLVDVIRRRARFAGQAFAWSFILYAVSRGLLIEPLRGDFVERNPRWGWHVAAAVEVSKDADSPPVHVERGAAVADADGRKGTLLETLDLPAGEARATVHAISDGPAKPQRTSPLFGDRRAEPPEWDLATVAGLPAGVTLSPGRSRWYGSDLPKPPNYVSTSQWISVLIVAGGVLMLVVFRRTAVPPWSAAANRGP
jgi:hypothetical protein